MHVDDSNGVNRFFLIRYLFMVPSERPERSTIVAKSLIVIESTGSK